MMSTCCSKYVEEWNKYIKKECVKLVINQNYFENNWIIYFEMFNPLLYSRYEHT
jgi:hypothetical protein